MSAQEVAILRGIAMFERLPPPVLERLALNLEPIGVPAGATIFQQGDAGDRLYLVAAGEVEIYIDDQRVAAQGPGTEFGEIALLRDVPRTASVRALSDVELLAMPRHVFLSAVTGDAVSSRAAGELVRARLGEGDRVRDPAAG